MAENEIGSLYIAIKTDMAKLNQEIVATQAKMTSLANTVESAMQTLANTTTRTTRTAVTSAQKAEESYTRAWAKINQGAENFQIKENTRTAAAIEKANQMNIKQLGMFESQKIREQRIAETSARKAEQSYVNAWAKISQNAENVQAKQVIATEKAAQKKVDAEQKALNKIDKVQEDNHGKTIERIQRTMTAIAAVMAARFVLGGFESLVRTGLEFNATLETAKLGIGSILMAHGEFVNSVGKAKTGYDKLTASQQLSGEIVKQLQIDNLATAATLEQLVTAYQQTLGPALAKGFNTNQIRQFTVAMVQAAGAIGLNLNQIAEETRSLLQGTITSRNTRIATALGITNEDIRQMQGNTGALFTFLMAKLDAFKIAGIASQTTWQGLISNVSDMFKQTLGAGFEPLFNYAKEQLIQLQNYLVKIDASGNFTINPEVLNAFKSIGSFIIGFIDLFKILYPIMKTAFSPILLAMEALGKVLSLGGKIIDKFSLESSTQLNKNITDLKEKIASDFRTPAIEIPVAITIPQKKIEEAKQKIEAIASGAFVDLTAATTGRGKFQPQFLKDIEPFVGKMTKTGALEWAKATGHTAEYALNLIFENLRKKELSIVITADTSKFKPALEALTDAQKSEIDSLRSEVNDYWTFVDDKIKYVGAIQIRNLLLQIDSQKTLNDLLPEQMASLLKIAEARDKAKSDTAKELLDKKAVKQLILDQYVYEKQIAGFQDQVIAGRKSYAESIGDTDTVNKLLQDQVNIKNELIQRENFWFLMLHPEAQKYIDELKQQNQLTTDQQILLNNLAKQTAIADASKQAAELTYNWDELAIVEQKTLDLAIEKQRIENQANPELLAYLEQIYQLKSRNISLDVRSKALAMQEPVAQAATSLYATSGNENLLDIIKEYNNKVIALTKDKNAAIYTDEKEMAVLLLALKQDTNDKLYQLELARYNKQYEAYSKLYKATGLQQYADKLVQIENQILDKEDYFNNQIVDNEQDAFRLRQIRMQEFYQSRLDMIESTGNKEIAKAKEVAEIVASFNVPLAGSNISSMTGMPIGNVGQRFGNTNYPGVWFGSQQELTDYMKNFNQTSYAGGLVKVTGPATGGSDQWFKTMQDANKFIEDWKNGLGQATTSVSNLSSAVDTLTSKFQSSYQSFQSFLTERERRNWTAADWTREFDRLVSVFNSNPDVETQINTLNSMLDVLKELDKTQQETLQTQKQIANDFLSSAKSVDELINSLKFGPMNPGVSYGGMTTQYESLKSGAVGTGATAEGVNKFTSFIQNTYLPFMKTYGSGYFDKLDEVTSELGLVSDELKGKAAYISLANALGIDVDIKEPVGPRDIFDFSAFDNWKPEQIKLFTEDQGTGYSLFERITESWTVKRLELWKDLFDKTNIDNWQPEKIFMWSTLFDKTDVDLWNPESLELWGKLFDKTSINEWKPQELALWGTLFNKTSIDNWKPETIELWGKLFDKINVDAWQPETIELWGKLFNKTSIDNWKPETIELWGKLFDKTNIDNWQPETISLIGDILNLTDANGNNIFDPNWTPEAINVQAIGDFDFAGLFADISTGNLTSATEKINDLIDILGGTDPTKLVGATGNAQSSIENLVKKFAGSEDNALTNASGSAIGSTGLLTTALNDTETPFSNVSTKVESMATNVKDNLTAVADMFTALAAKMGVSLGSAGGFAEVIQKINTQTVSNTEYVKPEYIYWTKLTNNLFSGDKNQYGILVPGQDYVTVWSINTPNPVPYHPPKAGAGALTSGLTLAGELGPEYVVPTYEPQRSNFLKTVGVDTDKISDMMVTEQINTMSNFLDKLQIPSSNYEVPKYESPSTNTINIDSEKIGKEIARQLAASLVTTGSNGKDIKIQLVVDGKVLSDVIASNIYNGHEGLAKNIKKLVGVR